MCCENTTKNDINSQPEFYVELNKMIRKSVKSVTRLYGRDQMAVISPSLTWLTYAFVTPVVEHKPPTSCLHCTRSWAVVPVVPHVRRASFISCQTPLLRVFLGLPMQQVMSISRLVCLSTRLLKKLRPMDIFSWIFWKDKKQSIRCGMDICNTAKIPRRYAVQLTAVGNLAITTDVL